MNGRLMLFRDGGKIINIIHVIILAALLLLLSSPKVNALSIVVLNQGGSEPLALCTAKRCAAHSSVASSNEQKEKQNTVSFISSSQKSVQSRHRQLMYGLENEEENSNLQTPVDEQVKLISTGEEIAEALQPADALIIVSNESPCDPNTIKPIFSYVSSSLKRVLLISKQDASSGGGFFGGGKSYQKAEESLRALVKKSGSSLAILRCGTLKGGGAGYSNLGGRVEGYEDKPEIGLSSVFYKSNFDLTNAMTTIGHDRFTLGPYIVKGDPNKMPNPLLISATKDSIDASPTETNICTAAVVATSLVEMCNDPSSLIDLEISLGCEKSEELPTVQTILEKIKVLV